MVMIYECIWELGLLVNLGSHDCEVVCFLEFRYENVFLIKEEKIHSIKETSTSFIACVRAQSGTLPSIMISSLHPTIQLAIL